MITLCIKSFKILFHFNGLCICYGFRDLSGLLRIWDALYKHCFRDFVDCTARGPTRTNPPLLKGAFYEGKVLKKYSHLFLAFISIWFRNSSCLDSLQEIKLGKILQI